MIKRLLSVFLVFIVLAACVLPVFCEAEAASLLIGSASIAGLSSASAAAVTVPIIGAVVLAACAAGGAYLYIGNQAKSEGLTRTEWLQEHYPGLFTGAFLSGISVTAAGEWLLNESSAEILDSFMTDISGNIISDSNYCTLDGVAGTVLSAGNSWTMETTAGRTYVFSNRGSYDIYIFPYSTIACHLVTLSSKSVFYYKVTNSLGSNLGSGTITNWNFNSNFSYYSNSWSFGGMDFQEPFVDALGQLDYGTGIPEDYTGFGGALDYFDTSVIDNRNGLLINPDIIDFDDSSFSGTLEADRYAQLYLDWLDGKTAEEAGYPDITLNPTDVIDPSITSYLDTDVVTDAEPLPEAAEAVEGETAEDTTDDYTLDLKDLFPFCIPFDLYDIFVAFNGSAVAPSWSWSFTVYDEEYTISGDLSIFDSVAAVCRTLELIAFCVCLAIGTKNLIQGS